MLIAQSKSKKRVQPKNNRLDYLGQVTVVVAFVTQERRQDGKNLHEWSSVKTEHSTCCGKSRAAFLLVSACVCVSV